MAAESLADPVAPARRGAALLEVALGVGLILAVIWVVKPAGRPALDLGFRAGIAVLLVSSSLFHRDRPARLGLRFDNFPAVAGRALAWTAAASAALLAIGAASGSIREPPRMVINFFYNLVWGGLQQYALQGVVLLRLIDAGFGRRAPVAAAALFSVVHAPNPGLMALTFGAGWLWCALFRRYPNLPALAISQACLVIVAQIALPEAITHGFRVGPSYLQSLD